MELMKSLHTTQDLVEEILEQNETARSSDNYLMYLVFKTIGLQKGVNIDNISMPTFLLNMQQYGMPSFETVRRTRQKIQQRRDDLRPAGKVAEHRADNEDIYYRYAGGTRR